MKFKIVDGPLVGQTVNLDTTKWISWEIENRVATVHEYRFNLERMEMIFIKTLKYNVDERKIIES